MMPSIDADVPVHSSHSYFNRGVILLNSDDGKWFLYNSVEKEAKSQKGFSEICWVKFVSIQGTDIQFSQIQQTRSRGKMTRKSRIVLLVMNN